MPSPECDELPVRADVERDVGPEADVGGRIPVATEAELQKVGTDVGLRVAVDVDGGRTHTDCELTPRIEARALHDVVATNGPPAKLEPEQFRQLEGVAYLSNSPHRPSTTLRLIP